VGKIEQGMIEYTYPWPEMPTVKIPKLHKVNYNAKYNFGEAYRWCQENCRAAFYSGPGWNGRFMEFEDDVDATAFAMRFS